MFWIEKKLSLPNRIRQNRKTAITLPRYLGTRKTIFR